MMGESQIPAGPPSRFDLRAQVAGLAYFGCSGVSGGGGGGGLLLILFGLQGYQWLKDKVQSEDGKKQQAKVMDLLPIAHQLGCTVAQLAIGETLPTLDPAEAVSPSEKLSNPRVVCPEGESSSSETLLKFICSFLSISSLAFLLWLQRGVSAVRVSARSCWGCRVQSS